MHQTPNQVRQIREHVGLPDPQGEQSVHAEQVEPTFSNLRTIVYLGMYDSGEVSLEHLLLSWYPFPQLQTWHVYCVHIHILSLEHANKPGQRHVKPTLEFSI